MATCGLELYGPEIMSYLATTMRDREEGREAFALFCAGLWEALPGFRWECTFRTWSYTVAHNAARRVARARAKDRVVVAIALAPEVEEISQKIRSATPEFLQPAFRRRLARLRANLSAEDRELLFLRVQRKLTWAEIARIRSDDPEQAGEDLTRAAAALRKRFERLKQELKLRAREP
jgi:RNA polymerase sigma-70 factor, ECF subfamily